MLPTHRNIRLNVTDVAVAYSCRRLKALDVSGCTILTDRSLLAIAECCPGLINFEVAVCNISDATLFKIAASYPALRQLGLYSCPHITDAELTAIAQGCSHIKMLDIGGYSISTDSKNC